MDRQTRATLQQYQVFTFSYVGRQGKEVPCLRSEHPAAAPCVWMCRTYGLGSRGLRITDKRLWCNDCVRAIIESGCSTIDAADRFMLQGRLKQAAIMRACDENTGHCLTSVSSDGFTDGYLVTAWLLGTLAGKPVLPPREQHLQREPQHATVRETTYTDAEMERTRLAILLMYEVDRAEVLSKDEKSAFCEVLCTWGVNNGIFTSEKIELVQAEIHRQNEQQHE